MNKKNILIILLIKCYILIVLKVKKKKGNINPRYRNLFITKKPIYGSSSELNYYYIDLYIGFPIQHQSLIIDTGSQITAFPCSLCKNCYRHSNKKYTIDKDSFLNCNDNYCKNMFNNKCFNDNNFNFCGFENEYAENSKIEGYYFNETFSLFPEKFYMKNFNFTFGCIINETESFNEQFADGILGLASEKYSISGILKENGIINDNLFSFCFGNKDGYFTIGEIIDLDNNNLNDINIIEGNIQFDIIYGKFTIELNNITIDNHIINIDQNNYNTFIDSGSTVSIFPKPIFNEFYEIMNNIIDKKYINKDKVNLITDIGMCYTILNKYVNLFINKLPNLYFKFNNSNIEYILNSNDYIYNYTQYNNNNNYQILCIGFRQWDFDAIVLGTTFLRNHELIFNFDKKIINFIQSNCELNNEFLNKFKIEKISDEERDNFFKQKYLNNLPFFESPKGKNVAMIILIFIVIIILIFVFYFISKSVRLYCINKFNCCLKNNHVNYVVNTEIDESNFNHNNKSFQEIGKINNYNKKESTNSSELNDIN